MVSLLVLYHSQEFGNTEAMAKAVAEGAQKVDAEVTLVNTNTTRFNPEEFRPFDVVAFGTPDYFSYIAGGLKVFVDDWWIAQKTDPKGLYGKSYGLFYSHGGGGAVRKPFESLFRSMKIGSKIGETIESYGKPNNAVLKACRELGQQLIASLKK